MTTDRTIQERDLAREATAWGAFRLIADCVIGDPVRAGQLAVIFQKVGMREIQADTAKAQVLELLYPGP